MVDTGCDFVYVVYCLSGIAYLEKGKALVKELLFLLGKIDVANPIFVLHLYCPLIMSSETKKDELQLDCKIKAKNLQTALDSVVNYNFQSVFLLQNYIRCKEESIASVEKLIEHLESID